MNRLLPLALVLWSGVAQAEDPPGMVFGTPGAHFFASATPSPLAGAGTRAPLDANFVYIDEAHTKVVVNAGLGQIQIQNTHTYLAKAIIADLLFLGRGHTKAGEDVPVAVHLKVQKVGDTIQSTVHAHVTVRDSFTKVALDAFTVEVNDGKRTSTVLTPQMATDAVVDPKKRDELARSLLKFKDHLKDKKGDPTQPGYELADVSLGIGRGPLRKYVMRAAIVSLSGDNAPLIATGNLAKMLSEGTWLLRLSGLSSLLPQDSVKRHLTLLGIADIPVLAGVMKDGLEKGQVLTFTLAAGTGSVSVDGKSAPLPNAIDVARAYLEFNFLGLILTDQARRRVSAKPLSAEPPSAKP